MKVIEEYETLSFIRKIDNHFCWGCRNNETGKMIGAEIYFSFSKDEYAFTVSDLECICTENNLRDIVDFIRDLKAEEEI